MLYELEVLEIRHIADLAQDARKLRDRLLEKVPEADLAEPGPARGEHNPPGDLTLTGVLDTQPEMLALRQALAALPRAVRMIVWAVARTGRGEADSRSREALLAAALPLSDDDIVADLMEQPDLHEHLRKGLYILGAGSLPE
ncbi:MAG TPA: DUF3775 domain-containing protein [Rhodopila sp.]|nr:DUF3775 domain-containing protein [Rhodopila sp.]